MNNTDKNALPVFFRVDSESKQLTIVITRYFNHICPLLLSQTHFL